MARRHYISCFWNMVGTELITAFKAEINHYLGIPYFKNTGVHKNNGTNAMVGKGDAKEIALLTVEMANQSKTKLLELTNQQIYNFQKKNHIGIDCSGLATNLLNYYGSLTDKEINLNPRRTSADMLTSSPLSVPISLSDITTADLVRQKLGHHVVVIVAVENDLITYVESRQTNRKVKYGSIKLSDPNFFKEGIFRLKSLI